MLWKKVQGQTWEPEKLNEKTKTTTKIVNDQVIAKSHDWCWMFWDSLIEITFYLSSGFLIICMDLDESFKISLQEEGQKLALLTISAIQHMPQEFIKTTKYWGDQQEKTNEFAVITYRADLQVAKAGISIKKTSSSELSFLWSHSYILKVL